ncbi:MAG: hypothetical protein AAF658_06385, partial [Myxococcota bacterium]
MRAPAIALFFCTATACDSSFDVFERAPFVASEVDSSWFSTVALTPEGVIGWGDVPGGGLGVESEDQRLPPSSIDAASRIALAAREVSLRLGERSTCLLADGELRCWGLNEFGQLGVGDFEPRLAPGEVVALPAPVASFDLFRRHVCAVLVSGELWCWGWGVESQINPGPGRPETSATPVRYGDDSDWTRVAVGDGHSCGVRSGTDLYCWGRNTERQAGGASTQAQVRSAS